MPEPHQPAIAKEQRVYSESPFQHPKIDFPGEAGKCDSTIIGVQFPVPLFKKVNHHPSLPNYRQNLDLHVTLKRHVSQDSPTMSRAFSILRANLIQPRRQRYGWEFPSLASSTVMCLSGSGAPQKYFFHRQNLLSLGQQFFSPADHSLGHALLSLPEPPNGVSEPP